MKCSAHREGACRASISMRDPQTLRREMRTRRAALDEEAQQAASLAVCKRIKALPAYQQAATVMAYWAVRGELSEQPLLEDALKAGKTLLLPRCKGQGWMEPCAIQSLHALVPGLYGIPEPGKACTVCPPETIDLVLVQGTAFDRRGGRIGQGGGYYDRFLPKTKAVRAGICHEFALFETLPQTRHDVRMDCMITPQETIDIKEDER